MERRIQQLELKIIEHQRANVALRDDVKSLKDIQNDDRREYQEGFEYHDTKKKKLFGLLGEVNKSIDALQNQQDSMATKTELQYVAHRPLLSS